MVLVPTTDQFLPDIDAIKRAITPRTRAVLVNSPNNPTGVVYGSEDYDGLARLLVDQSKEHGRPIYLISDEPYRAISYEGVDVPWPVQHYANTIHVTSFSKDLAIPGERIGYVAVNPTTEHGSELASAFTFANRILGFVNAPALQQRLVAGLLETQIDLSGYTAKRKRLIDALTESGYDFVRPLGAFYLFPSVPTTRQKDGKPLDDVAFVKLCLDERLLVVPGSGFGCPGHFRMSYAVRDLDIDLAVDAPKTRHAQPHRMTSRCQARSRMPTFVP